MKDVSLGTSFFVACIGETLVYGIAFALYVISVQYILTQRRTREGLSKPLLFTLPLLFTFATLHMFGVWVRTYREFVELANIGDGGTYWNVITSTEKTITQVGLVGAIILGDAMIVYRTYMVWSRSLVVIFAPCVTMVGTAVAGVGVFAVQHVQSMQGPDLPNVTRAWTLSFLGASLITTVTCTVVIAYKLRTFRPFTWDRAASTSKNTVHEIWRVVVGSAFIYSVCTLVYVILYATRTNAEIWFSGIEASVCSICFSLITMRIEWATRETNAVTFTFPNKQATTRWTSGSLSIISPRKNEFTISPPPDSRKVNRRVQPAPTVQTEASPGDAANTSPTSTHKSPKSPKQTVRVNLDVDLEKQVDSEDSHERSGEAARPRTRETILDISPTAQAALGHYPDPPPTPYVPDRRVRSPQ